MICKLATMNTIELNCTPELYSYTKSFKCIVRGVIEIKLMVLTVLITCAKCQQQHSGLKQILLILDVTLKKSEMVWRLVNTKIY